MVISGTGNGRELRARATSWNREWGKGRARVTSGDREWEGGNRRDL